MCTSWSKSLLMLGVMASLVNHWFVILAVYPLAASLTSRITGRNIWPATATCRLPNPSGNRTKERMT